MAGVQRLVTASQPARRAPHRMGMTKLILCALCLTIAACSAAPPTTTRGPVEEGGCGNAMRCEGRR